MLHFSEDILAAIEFVLKQGTAKIRKDWGYWTICRGISSVTCCRL